MSLHRVIQSLYHVINYVVRQDDLLNCYCTGVIEALLVEDFMDDFESTTIPDHFLKTSAFKFNVVMTDIAVVDHSNHLLIVWILKLD